MTTMQIVSLVLLVPAFGVAMWRDINVGLVTIPLALVVGLSGGMAPKEIMAGFPAGIVLLIIGVMYLFAHAKMSGAMDLMVGWAVKLCGDRLWLMPWVMFVLGAVIAGIGTLPSAAVAITLPIAMQMARTYKIPATLMAVITLAGAGVGGFSPVAPWTKIIEESLAKLGVHYSAMSVFLVVAALQIVLALVAFVVLGGLKVMRSSRSAVESAETGEPVGAAFGPGACAAVELESGRTRSITPYQVCSLLGLLAFVVVVFFFDVDVVTASFVIAIVLHVLFKPSTEKVISGLPWAVVLLTSGILIYVGVLEHLGTLKQIASGLEHVSSPILAVLAMLFLGTIFATFESSTVAVLGITAPIAAAVVPGGSSSLVLVCIIAALCVSVSSVAVSPFHLGGAFAVANVDGAEQNRVFRHLLMWSLGAAVLVPLVTLAVPVAVGL